MPLGSLDTLTRKTWVSYTTVLAKPRSAVLQAIDNAVDGWAQVAGVGGIVPKRAALDAIVQAIDVWIAGKGSKVSKRLPKVQELRAAALSKRKGIDQNDGTPNRIVSVELLDGGPHRCMAAKGVQYVNLNQDAKWVDGAKVSSIDRLGRGLRVKVTFLKTGDEPVKLRLLSHQSNATYTDQEKLAKPAYNFNRTPLGAPYLHYSHRHGDEQALATHDSHVLVTDQIFEVSPAVGDRYIVEAEDQAGNKVYSQKLTTRRLIYFMVARSTKAVDPLDVNNLRQELEQELANNATDAEFLGELTFAKLGTLSLVSNAWIQPLKELLDVKVAGRGDRRYSDYDPHLLRLVFVDQLAGAYKGTTIPTPQVPVGPGQGAATVTVQFRPPPPTDPTADMRKGLWIGLCESTYENEVATGTWFCEGKLTYSDGTEVDVPARLCTPVELDPVGRQGFFPEVQVRVDKLPARTATGSLKLTVVTLNQCVAGRAKVQGLPGVIFSATRNRFEKRSEAEQISSVLHEVGHALGMVPTLHEQGVEAHMYQYDYNGSHCRTGLGAKGSPGDYHTDPASVTAANMCLMFGLIHDPPLYAFCADCRAALRKVDLSAGFTE